MSTTPQTPVIESPTAEGLRAVLEAGTVETPPPAPPAPPVADPAPPPTWGQMQKGEDGSYQVTLATGEVFKGTADEVIAKQAEAQVNTKRWGQEWKQKAEAVPQPPSPPQPAAPQLSDEEKAAQRWAIEQVAAGLGVTADEFISSAKELFQSKQDIQNMTMQQKADAVAMEFSAACPDYVPSDANREALLDYIADDVKQGRRAPSLQELKQAHATALYEKRYAAASLTVPQVPAPPAPPAMPSSGAATQAPDANPWTMDKNELRKRMIEEWRNL